MKEKKQKEKKSNSFVIIVLILILIILSSLFLYDKFFRTQNLLKDITSQRDSLVYKNKYLSSQYTTINDSYTELMSNRITSYNVCYTKLLRL